MAGRLVDLCENALAGWRSDGERIAPRPTCHVVTTSDALRDRDQTPGWLLHTLTGGRMQASSRLVHRMVEQRGVDLRGIVLDDTGELLGVGRLTRMPPDWLRAGIHARDTLDVAPGSHTQCSATTSTTSPRGNGEQGGRTNAANLQPIGQLDDLEPPDG